MQLQIDRSTYTKIMHWINKSSDEVSGFGRVTYHAETGVFQIHDAYLLEQTNGAAHTDIDGASLAKLMYKTKDEEGELKWWWHSHVNMAVFWSGTDTATIKELASQGWMLATVFNKKEEMRSALGYAETSVFGANIAIKDELDTYIMDEVDEEAWDAEYAANVKQKTYGSGYQGGFNRGWDERAWDDRGVPATKLKSVEAGDLEWYREFGWAGAGAWEEAKALGMGYKEYMDLLLNGGMRMGNEIDKKLDELLATGVLSVKAGYEYGT